MQILWITNIVFPEALEKIKPNSQLRSSGGWMLAAAEPLISNNNSLVVATVSKLVTKLTKVSGAKITYYIIPYGRGNEKINPNYESYWKKINQEVSPDVVHIHGTEFSHGYSYIKACGSHNVVISLQGILSACSRYYTCGISNIDIYRNLTLRDVLKGTILRDKRRFAQRSKYEREMLLEVSHVIGRTEWDKAQVLFINPSIKYHFCNETLRPEFYSGDLWSYNNCRNYSIFISQAGYPIKGFHQLLKSLPIVLRDFPNTIVRVAGPNITKCNKLIDIIHFSGYGAYIKYLIKKHNLHGKIQFLGPLTAEEIKQEYLNSNVFVCPSSIENSPNSLCEAQILGVPCIASFVGGIPDIMAGNEENLYQFDDIEMLAYKICRIFKEKRNSHNQVLVARQRHDVEINRSNLIHIYRQLISQDES